MEWLGDGKYMARGWLGDGYDMARGWLEVESPSIDKGWLGMARRWQVYS